MKQGTWIFKSLLSIICSGLFFSVSSAASVEQAPNWVNHPITDAHLNAKNSTDWFPRLTGWGFVNVSDQEVLGKFDWFFPFFQEKRMPFLDVQGRGSSQNDSWTASVGLGCRQRNGAGDRLWSGYIFGDYSHILTITTFG